MAENIDFQEIEQAAFEVLDENPPIDHENREEIKHDKPAVLKKP